MITSGTPISNDDATVTADSAAVCIVDRLVRDRRRRSVRLFWANESERVTGANGPAPSIIRPAVQSVSRFGRHSAAFASNRASSSARLDRAYAKKLAGAGRVASSP